MFSVAAAIVGALIGSAMGVLLTNHKLRRERGFDRRLQWCESMMGALNAAGAAVTSASTGEEPEGREECWTQTIHLYESLIPLCGQKELYAPEAAITLIDTFMRELALLIEAHLAGHETPTARIPCDRCLAKLASTVAALTALGRNHLGLEKLPDHSTSTERFLGSFRGRKLIVHDKAITGSAGRIA